MVQENKDRTDIDPFEYARGIERFAGFCNTRQEAWEGLAMSESYFNRWLSLLNIEPMFTAIIEKKMKAGEARHVASTEGELRDYTQIQRIYKDEPEVIEDIIEETLDLRPPERKRVLNGIKAEPEKAAKDVGKFGGGILQHLRA